MDKEVKNLFIQAPVTFDPLAPYIVSKHNNCITYALPNSVFIKLDIKTLRKTCKRIELEHCISDNYYTIKIEKL